MVIELVCRKHADVLFVQELTDEAAGKLQQAGLGDLLPHRVTQPVPHGARDSIYARYPLLGGPLAAPVSAARAPPGLTFRPGSPCTGLRTRGAAEASLVSGRHARWRGQLSALPAPGDSPRILAGDFNATLDHAQFRGLLRRGYVDAASQAGHGLSLTSGTTTRPAPEPARNQPRPHRPALRGSDHVGPLADRQRPPRTLC